MIAGWLKAGVVEAGVGFTPTTEGVPQGGLCSAEHNDPNEQCWVMRSGPRVVPGGGETGGRIGVDRCA
jgi:hypothetical protein